jgi:dTDP-glucose pyrophosphorylase
MAGLYKRFRNAHYQVPKFLLPWENETILSYIIKNMVNSGAFSRLVLIANKRDIAYSSDIEKILDHYRNIPAYLNFIEDTKGQAETAYVSCQWLKQNNIQDKRVIFHNIDTILLGRNYIQYGLLLQDFAGLIDVFLADSPAYSYVAIDESRLVKRIAEKVVISSYATTGLYGFHSYEDFMRYYQLAHYPGEYYISDIYHCMLQQHENIIIPPISSIQRTLVLGTPEEYENARSKKPRPLSTIE